MYMNMIKNLAAQEVSYVGLPVMLVDYLVLELLSSLKFTEKFSRSDIMNRMTRQLIVGKNE